jgi:hypothetical protein
MGSLVGFITFIATAGTRDSGDICWLTGGTSMFVTFIVSVYVFAKRGPGVRTPARSPYRAPPPEVRGPPPPSTLTREQRAPPAPSEEAVFEAINGLPKGLPMPLWGQDWNKLAWEVSTGTMGTSRDGRPIAFVTGDGTTPT